MKKVNQETGEIMEATENANAEFETATTVDKTTEAEVTEAPSENTSNKSPMTAADVKPQEPAEEEEDQSKRVMETIGTIIGIAKFDKTKKTKSKSDCTGMVNVLLATWDEAEGFSLAMPKVGSYFVHTDIFSKIQMFQKVLVMYTTQKGGDIFVKGLKPYVEVEAF